MAGKQRKLGRGVQSLEAKTMMAGDAAVVMSGGDLFIDEAGDSVGEDQQVQVSKLEDGTIQVKGLNGTMLQTPYFYFDWNSRTIQRGVLERETLTYNNINDINVDLGGGDDDFRTKSYNGDMEVGAINIDMGAGHDDVRLAKTNASGLVDIKTGSGNDYVNLNTMDLTAADQNYVDELKIDTGDGLDTVSLFRTNVNGDVKIDTSDNDSLNERDNVYLTVTTMDDLDVDLGGGSDYMRMRFVTMDDGEINGGDGNDDVYAEAVEADNLEFNGEAGVDEFFARYYSGSNSNNIDDLDLSSAVSRVY